MTFMKSACRAAGVTPLLQDPHVRATVSEITEGYNKYMNEDKRGTRIHDAVSLKKDIKSGGDPGNKEKSVKLEADVYRGVLARLNSELNRTVYVPRPRKAPDQFFLSEDAIVCNKIQVKGVRYQPASVSAGNSNIMFTAPGSSSPVAGQISQIFIHERKLPGGESKIKETFLAVRPLARLSQVDEKLDIYRTFPIVGGSLHYARYDDRVHVIRPSDIVCHFAKTRMGRVMQISEPCFHVLPLDRVRPCIFKICDNLMVIIDAHFC